jgi:ADP-dependent NAD(P)H-hydrate dehydratase / NAD(P)H-hydrate epimerase
MIPVLNKNQIKQADAYTIEHEPITSLALMDRAVKALRKKLKPYLPSKSSGKISIVCGTGNNGGDGLVLGRILASDGYDVSLDILKFSEKSSNEFSENFNLLNKTNGIQIRTHTQAETFEVAAETTHLVDAIFGVGFEGKPDKNYLEVFHKINQSETFKVSIDMPSGLPANEVAETGEFIQADKVFTFQCPKLSLFLQQHQLDFELVDIGLDSGFIHSLDASEFLIESQDAVVPKRPKHAYKNIFGHALICAGSKGMYGAAVLCSNAALSSGSGLVTVCVPREGARIIHHSAPELMVVEAGEDCLEWDLGSLESYTVLAIGPGIGKNAGTASWLRRILTNRTQPAVIDADALNIISENKHFDCIKPGDVLTPHEGEFKRLVGEWKDDLEKLEKLKSFSKETGAFVVLKGAYTCIAKPDQSLYFNSTGHPAMATAGSGDVLCGMITGLIASGLEPFKAAVCGVFYHGKAGEQAAAKKKFIKASDLIKYLDFQ